MTVHPTFYSNEERTLFHLCTRRNALFDQGRTIAIKRLSQPWKETLSLPSLKKTLKVDWNLPQKERSLLGVLETNPITSYRCCDFFQGGSDCLVFRAIMVTNLNSLKRYFNFRGNVFLEGRDDAPFLFRNPVFYRGDYSGTCYCNGYPATPSGLTWIDQQFGLDETVAQEASFRFYTNHFKKQIALLNETNRVYWEHRLNGEFLTTLPYWVLKNTVFKLTYQLDYLITQAITG